MAQSTFHLLIASVGKTHFDGPAIAATFPGVDGEFTVLAHHEPFVTTLKKGAIRVRASSESPKEFTIDSGVLEVSNNRAVVLL